METNDNAITFPITDLTPNVTPSLSNRLKSLSPVQSFSETPRNPCALQTYHDEYKLNMNEVEKQIFTELQRNSVEFHEKKQQIRDIMHTIFRLQGHSDSKPFSPHSFEVVLHEKREIDHFSSSHSKTSLVQLDDSDIDKIKNTFEVEMNGLLSAIDDGNLFKLQCANNNCMDDSKDDNILENCPCFQRVCVFLKICHKFCAMLNQQIAVNFADYLQINNGYDANGLAEDFNHIIINHIGHKMQKVICSKINEKYPCKLKKCYHRIRHDKETKLNENNKNISTPPESLHLVKSTSQDVAFSQLIDTIHCYFLHSDVPSGCHPESSIQSEKMKSKYIGRNEDEKWIRSIEHIKISNEWKVYKTLVKKCAVYRWQSTTAKKEFQDLAHVKPKFKNPKEEALKNMYFPLSIENWNQTVAKVNRFKKSFAAERMRTHHNGEYYDDTMKNKATWKKGEIPNKQEITVIKLYTDWDELQSELKKCFRLTSVEDIVQRY
eukprot:195455_1